MGTPCMSDPRIVMPLRMFVRFRQQGRRLQPSLMQTRRVAGKVRNEHVASLGSVDADVSVRERLAYWAKLPDRLARLGNRVSPDDHAKIFAAVHARIPMVTPDEQRAIQEENAKDDERFWDTMRDMNAASVEEHKVLIARAEANVADHARNAAEAAKKANAAKDHLDRLRRGDTVAGGLGKRLDLVAALKAAGWTPSMMRHAESMSNLTEAEFETLITRSVDVGSHRLRPRTSPDHPGAEIGPHPTISLGPWRSPLQFQGRRRGHGANEIMAENVAKRLVEHLERAGVVAMQPRRSGVGGARGRL